MFSDVAMEVPKYKFENVLDRYKEENNFKFDTDLTSDHLKEIVEEYKTIYKNLSFNNDRYTFEYIKLFSSL